MHKINRIDTGYSPTNLDKNAAEIAKEKGCPYQAEYILMFGLGALDPGIWQGISPEFERHYKRFVEEGHPWDWYYEYEGNEIF